MLKRVQERGEIERAEIELNSSPKHGLDSKLLI